MADGLSNGSYPAIRSFLRQHYSDERLAALLAHAEDGKLSFHSCCCFIGIATAKHPLQSYIGPYDLPTDTVHLVFARKLVGADEAEGEFRRLAPNDDGRQALIIPIIHDEMLRREVERRSSEHVAEYLYETAVRVSEQENERLAARGRGEQP